MVLNLRPATLADLSLLEHWDEQPHVIDSNPKDRCDWQVELEQNCLGREKLIAEINGRPIGFIEITNPGLDDSNYWGDARKNVRAIDIWIGEVTDLGKGYGTKMLQLALKRCFANPS
jgi:aminoglycoside 6'-N-acetyltransferase